MSPSTIKDALRSVRADIAAAAQTAGRDPASVKLLAVSKTKPAEAVAEAYDAGQRDFGENYSQELVQKAAALSHLAELRWHHIGHLQSNKVKQLLPIAYLFHGVDRLSLSAEMDKRAAVLNRPVGVLVEVSLGDEETKSGCSPDELAGLVAAVRASHHLELCGLMTMPPLFEDPELARPYFRRLRELRDAHGGAEALPELSMGMSNDFRVAIEEGATIVRVGTAIFGGRGH